jgi:ATP-dependent protease HslVU (ClpYQ) peptidase subunit
MTTCVVVRKNNSIAIAADSLVTFGDTRLSQAYEANDKIIQVGESYISLAGTTAHFPVMKKLLTDMGEECRLTSREEVFETFTRVHQILKEKYFLNTKEEEDDPYESSQITTLIANPYGIFGVYSYREVFSFDRFWAIGSGTGLQHQQQRSLGDLVTDFDFELFDDAGLIARNLHAGLVGLDGNQRLVDFDRVAGFDQQFNDFDFFEVADIRDFDFYQAHYFYSGFTSSEKT